jgi:signal recognition particle subunit SEC65
MPDYFYVYPEYLARGTPRSMGRRVPSSSAASDATIDEIVRVARALGFEATAEPEKSYPRQFYRYDGRVKIAKKAGVTKTAFLRRLAAELQRRGPRPKA